MALGAAAAVKSAGLEEYANHRIRRQSRMRSRRSSAASCRQPLCSPQCSSRSLLWMRPTGILKTGSTGKPELQIIPCDLVTKSNADNYRNFEKVR